MIIAALLTAAALLPTATFQEGGRSGGSWTLLPFPDGSFQMPGPTRTLPTRPNRGNGSSGSTPTTPATEPSSTAPSTPTTGAPTTGAPPSTPNHPPVTSGPNAGAPASTPTIAGWDPMVVETEMPALLDLDTWNIWWRFRREGYLRIEPWQTAPMTGDAAGRTESGAISRATVRTRILPALVAALEDDPSEALRTALLLTLARIGDGSGASLSRSELHDLLADGLDDPNQTLAETACVSLGILASSGSLSTLSALLLDTEVGRELVDERSVPLRMRAFAAYGIGLLGQRTSISDVRAYATHTLVTALEHEVDAAPDERIATLVALSMIDPSDRPVASPAVATVGGSAGRIKDKCACASNDELARLLLDMLDTRREDERTRAHLPAALATLVPYVSIDVREDVIDALTTTASRGRERDSVREGCILALGRIGDADEDEVDEDIRKELTKLATDGNQRARSFAMIALARIAGRPGAGDGDPHAGTTAVRTFLLKRLGRARTQDRSWNALALGVMERALRDTGGLPSTDTLDALRDGLRAASSPEESAAYSIALGLSRDAGAMRALEEQLDDQGAATRSFVALALGMTGAPTAGDALRASLSRAKHEPTTLENTARALALLHDPATVPAILALDEECDCSLSRQGMALALGRTRHPDATLPLLELFENEKASDLERAYAAIGLGYLAEKDELAWSTPLASIVNYRATPDTLTSAQQGGILDLP